MPSDVLQGSKPAPAPLERTMTVFVLDQETEAVLREAMPAAHITASYRRGGLKTAIEDMAKSPSPDVLVIDISDCEADNSVTESLSTLAHLVEPDTLVMAIGEDRDVEFYRQIIRGFGIAEFVHKPVTRTYVANYFIPILTQDLDQQNVERGGRVIGVVGAKGGAGCTSITTHLARYIGMSERRHVMLIDAHMRQSACSVYLDIDDDKAHPKLLQVLNTPERIDQLLVERNLCRVDDRLDMLFADQKPGDFSVVPDGGGERLIETLKMRYNFIVIDLPILGQQPSRDFLQMVNHRVIVMDPSLVAVREARAILSGPMGRAEPQRPTVVLNRAGMRGGLTREHITKSGGVTIDVEIPDLGPQVLSASNMAQDLTKKYRPFKNGIEQIAREVGVLDLTASPAAKKKSLFGGLLTGRRKVAA